MIGVYFIRNLVNKKLYIGSSNDLKFRLITHKSRLNTKKHVNQHLQNAWDKYGENNFEFGIFAKCPIEYTLKLEQWFIDNLKPQYNICKVTTSSRLGVKNTIEHSQKIVRTKTENGFYKEHSQRMKGNSYRKGFKLSEINKANLRAARIEKGNKRVIQMSLDGLELKEWYTTTLAAKNFGVTYKAIHKAITNKGTSCGFKWKYKN